MIAHIVASYDMLTYFPYFEKLGLGDLRDIYVHVYPL
jgi:hypothetical protein